MQKLLTMPEIKITFHQELDSYKFDQSNLIEILSYTSEKISEPFLRLWATYELFMWYRLKTLAGLKTFKRTKPIKIETFVDNIFMNSYVQVKIISDLVYNPKNEYAFLLDDFLYVLQKQNYVPLKRKKTGPKQISPSNYHRIFNTIEYQQTSEIQYKSLLLFTGMTN